MAKKLPVEVEGGLYHVITRGMPRQDVFHLHDDHLKFRSLLAKQKERSPFYFAMLLPDGKSAISNKQ